MVGKRFIYSTFANKWKFEQMEIRTNGNLTFFLATFSRTNGNFSDFLLNETVFRYFVATCSRTNGNLTQNACTKNENGIPFVRERTVAHKSRGRDEILFVHV